MPVLAVLLSSCIAVCLAACTHEGGNRGSGGIVAQSPASNAVGGKPAAPAVFLDTSYAKPSGRTISVSGGGEAAARAFQEALDSARAGDVIAIEPGTSVVGNFVLPRKQGDGWTVIRSAAADDKLPAPGTRAGPANASVMPRLVTPNADPVIRTAAGAHHFRFIAVEFTTLPGWAINYGLVLLGDSGSQKTIDSVPHDLVLDRCYLHGNSTVNLRRGVALNSGSTSIIDSYIGEVHEAGADAQAICGWNGPGPFKIVNNYLEASGENVMFGGADPSIQGLVPSDIEFRRNHCSKPLLWMPGDPSYAGKHWSVKNILELKNARRVLIEGNLFENNWVDAQSGFAVLLTVRNQDGAAPWSVVEDVAFRNNIVRHSAGAISILGHDDNHPSEQVKRVLIENNLFEDIGAKRWGNNGRFLQIADTLAVTIDHNTALHTGNIITAYGAPSKEFVFTNNITPHNEYGVMGDGSSVGNTTLARYFPGHVFKKNVIAGGRSALYPADNFFPAGIDDVAFANPAAENYALGGSSPYKNSGTDGKNIGCDASALKAAFESAQKTRSADAAALGQNTPEATGPARGGAVRVAAISPVMNLVGKAAR
jgi:hypothetical protein